MIYSLIIPTRENDKTVDGYWVQDCTGTLEKAKEVAKKTSLVNSGQRIVITEAVISTVPHLSLFFNLKKVE